MFKNIFAACVRQFVVLITTSLLVSCWLSSSPGLTNATQCSMAFQTARSTHFGEFRTPQLVLSVDSVLVITSHPHSFSYTSTPDRHRITFKLVGLMYSVKIGQCPRYLREIVNHASAQLTRHNLWPVNCDVFDTPRLQSEFGLNLVAFPIRMRGTQSQLILDQHPEYIQFQHTVNDSLLPFCLLYTLVYY